MSWNGAGNGWRNKNNPPDKRPGNRLSGTQFQQRFADGLPKWGPWKYYVKEFINFKDGEVKHGNLKPQSLIEYTINVRRKRRLSIAEL